MRPIAPELAARLSAPVTTIAQAWRLTRTDGTVLGFTDHDADLAFDGTRFRAATGFTGGQVEAALGLSVSTQEVDGALSSEAIREEDIAAGRYDGARIESFAVDWTEPDARLLLDVHHLGELTRGETGFKAELRGIEAALDRVHGRTYRRRCDAVLGDERCGIDLSRGGRTRTGAVVSADGAFLVLSGLGEGPAGFVGGRLRVIDGAAAGLEAEIATASAAGPDTMRLVLLVAIEADLAPGTRVQVAQGCDRAFATCRDRFANTANFRGFPHMPGGDLAYATAKEDGLHDGSPLVP
ncbi:DUF2163 domain-containing protein [Aurantimonas sp. Leaf443]|uniref:DUF2163 domain-containing protein n=1 Tax=Aurantimonas sp. Leaf443 TaxID=1736378 RepID=UPI0006FA5FCB|nr:DUF2163 domain-containing protein [Aurantimonas sp. Leaf443]KQT88240.1 hypothetical protein ASG48_02050 [Aurantimonas sp. Leaf443]